MRFTRRRFLGWSAALGAGGALSGLPVGPLPPRAAAREPSLRGSRPARSICPYCAVGCGLLVHRDPDDGRILSLEGDPEHPINQGALCAKGAALRQLAESPHRLARVLYRPPRGTAWEEKTWDWALTTIAQRVKATRDQSFERFDPQGREVNRTTAIAHLGSAALDNEECWALQAVMRALGLVQIEHQARLCHSSTVAALAESFGRGAMTNHWIDLKNSDCILVMGANPAENHPIAFKWVMAALERGATLISVDPRFTRTSAKAHIYAPLRPGSDLAFLGGLIHYILSRDLWFRDYVALYTNASFLVEEGYGFRDGLFSGFDPERRAYDRATWAYQRDPEGRIRRDPGLAHSRCVLRLLEAHYARYTPDAVSEATGTPRQDLERVYRAFAATGDPGRAGTILYAMGWTQHSVGTQNIRAMTMIQLLLGNLGLPGGGVNALRGESNVQGSTDQGLLYHEWPGYLAAPRASQATLAAYLATLAPASREPQAANGGRHKPRYAVSYLKALFGARATPANDFGYAWLPKLEDGRGYAWLDIFDRMLAGQVRGLFAWGQNPACSGADAGRTRRALAGLDWLVNVNLFPNETGDFWHGPGLDPREVATEVFLLPAACSLEKGGSLTNSGRWVQWREAALPPPGEARPDGEILAGLFARLRALYARGGVHPAPILGLVTEGFGEDGFDPEVVARRLNGQREETAVRARGHRRPSELLTDFAQLAADGSTSCGNWLYCGSFSEEGPLAARRDPADPGGLGLFPGFAWSWPLNRRILYNRAAVDPAGRPWSPAKEVLAWREGRWQGDLPDGDAPPLADQGGAGILPFTMKPEGVASLFGPGLVDGPFPEHYEPVESPLASHPFSRQRHNPLARVYDPGRHSGPGDPRFPLVATTHRVAEHWQSGVMTRWQPWLLALEPGLFVELDPLLAESRGIKNGERCVVSSPRGRVEAVAMVTDRLRPLLVGGGLVHQVALPWCFGWLQPAGGGDAANLLTAQVADPNAGIPETKAFMVQLARKEG